MIANDEYRRCTLGYRSTSIGTSGKVVPQTMRLEPLALPDARHAMSRDADLPSQRAGAPALPPWRRFARLLDHPPDSGQRNRRLGPAARLVLEAVQPFSVKALRPLGHTRCAHAQARGDLLLPDAFAPQQNDVRPYAVTPRSRRGCDPTLQLLFLLGGHLKYRDRTCHSTLPPKRVTHTVLYVKAIVGQDTSCSDRLGRLGAAEHR